MPDLMSHLIIGLILAEIFSIKKKSLVVLGAIMPDILSKLDLVFFYLGVRMPLSFAYFHLPIMCFLISILLAPLFRYERFKTIIFINVGLISHFVSDLTMKHFVGGMYLLFPFSFKAYILNLIWPEQSIYIIIFSFFAYLLVRSIKKFLYWLDIIHD